MEFIISEKETPHGLLLVITDKALLGKQIEEGKKQLDLRKLFYQGSEASKEEAKKMLLKARHLHVTGKEAVALLVEAGLISGRQILFVNDVPHAEVVMGE